MRILCCTQAESLRLFDTLVRRLGADGRIERAGFTVADSWFYTKWLAERPDFERQGSAILKEWEVTVQREGKPDLALLGRYERELGAEAGLFGAIVADRRLFMGPDCSYSQDYRRRFGDDELLCILQRGLVEMERLFDELRPDVLASFICVTMLDYLAYLFARARGVRIANLRPTRIGDRVAFASTLNDPSPELAASYRRIRAAGSDHLQEARAYVKRVRDQHGRYEGVVSPSSRPALRRDASRRSLLKSLRGTAGNYMTYRRGFARDNHVPNPLRAAFFAGVVNPVRAMRARARFGQSYVRLPALAGIRYAFYPLHTEPEVSLLVYGRPYVNQIEVIRWLALSLPADMMLVVKEHPWMVGKRTMGAYRKLLNIPRVRLADPSLEARALVQGAAVVAVITGSVALEAAMLGTPVITFGDCPYNLLPQGMVRRCADPRELPSLLRGAVEEYAVDEVSLEAYVAAVMETSVSVNLYSVLLGKKNVFSERPSQYEGEIDRLAGHLLAHLEGDGVAMLPGAARW